MPPTYVRCWSTSGTLVPVIASYRHTSGHVFLVHKALNSPDHFSTTYAPIGFAAGSHASIEDAIARLESAENLGNTIARHNTERLDTYYPPYSFETGIPHADIWQVIERQKFTTKEYLAVPPLASLAGLTYPREHYLHLSTTETEDDYVAYTPSESYGQQDRQVRLRFGKYLKKTFPQLADHTIGQAVTELRAALALSVESLHFATDRATITDIFETRMCACGSGNSPSCMYAKFTSTTRPYHVYANSPDVAVAYVRRGSDIIARSVVSTKDKTWVRAYALDGDETLCQVLKDLLKAQGYKHGSLMGNRLSKCGSHMPYLDGDDQSVDDDGTYWRVASGEDGEYTCTETDGTMGDGGERCSSCDRRTDDCECSYCDCCEESYQDGCDTCSMCEDCDRCYEHNHCRCSRCSDCHALLDNCNCERCERCSELEDDCDCETEDESAEDETLTANGVA